MKPALLSAADVRSERFRSRWTALACCSVVAAALLACKSKSPKRQPLSFAATPAAVGKYYNLTVSGAAECTVEEKYLQPDKGKVYVGLDVTFEATTEEQMSIHRYQLELKDQSGTSYKPSLGECKPAYETGVYVQKNQRLRGLVTFEVPENTTALHFFVHAFHNPVLGADETSVVLNRSMADAGR